MSHRTNARIIGICFILAAVTSIIGLILYAPVVGPDADFLTEPAANSSSVVLGAVFELILAVCAVGTAIFLFPYFRRTNESLALGYVLFRFLEVVFIVIGVVAVLSLLSLSKEFVATANPDVAAFQSTGSSLRSAHAWTFILGPNFMLGINTMIAGFLWYKSKLAPKFIGIMGMTGAAFIFLAAILELFGVILQISLWGALLAIPVFAYEMTTAVWLLMKGFNSDAPTLDSVPVQAP